VGQGRGREADPDLGFHHHDRPVARGDFLQVNVLVLIALFYAGVVAGLLLGAMLAANRGDMASRGQTQQRRHRQADDPRMVDGEDLNEFAGVLLGFRDWCIDREMTFRLALIRAVKQFMVREDSKAGGKSEQQHRRA
jgi:hypothetical protein